MKKTLFITMALIGSLQAAEPQSYWSRVASWWSSTTPSQYIPSADTCKAFVQENPVPTAIGVGATGLGLWGLYRYATRKPSEAISVQAKTEISNAILKGDRAALQSAITKAFNSPTDIQKGFSTTNDIKRAILAYALAEYKKHPNKMREFHDFMFAVYNAVLDTMLPTDVQEQLLNSKDSPLEFQALWQTIGNVSGQLTETDIATYYDAYNQNKS